MAGVRGCQHLAEPVPCVGSGCGNGRRKEACGKKKWFLLYYRVMEVPRSSNPIVVPLSSSNPLFFNGLKKAAHFSGNVGA